MNPLGRNMFNLAERQRIVDLALDGDCAVDCLQAIIRILRVEEAVTIEEVKRQLKDQVFSDWLTLSSPDEIDQSIQFLVSWGMVEPFGDDGMRLTVPSSSSQ